MPWTARLRRLHYVALEPLPEPAEVYLHLSRSLAADGPQLGQPEAREILGDSADSLSDEELQEEL